MFNIYNQVFILGILSLLHAAYSAAQHRAYLRITEQEFDGLPIDIFVQGVISFFVSMFGVLNLAGDFKEVRAIEELESKTWETLHNVPSFYIFNHRGKSLFSENH
ncbi:ER membrane protein complex subunit 5 [Daktulosphaira vitifoliae]|uniref:ER membrane protein complex subunit 5 n=1 Tax=Daktulosphaira vitifoliae TaxID=58002 RepID=UPI0021AAEF1F|nr:ER membrane protein complex subunit 5 [Daktulosphaira vitifoliae]